MKRIFYFQIIFTVLFFGCKTSKTKQVSLKEVKYFEEYQNKKVVAGHYGGYFLLDGNKKVFKIHLSDKEEILIESNSDENIISYSSLNFRENMVLLYNGNDVFRVVKGRVEISKKKNVIDVDLSVLGIKDMWEFVSESVPIVEDGNHCIISFNGELELKEEE